MLHAVVVGINEYADNQISRLAYARADAEEFVRRLENSVKQDERRVKLLVDAQATRSNIMKAIGEVLPRIDSADDLIVLYFAGHGSPETEGSPDAASRYLVAHDTEPGSVFATGIDMEKDINGWFRRIRKANLVFFFLDACFSGKAGGRTFEGPRLQAHRSMFRSGGPLSLKELDLGEGRVIISACTDDQVARERQSLGHGIFTHHLLEILSEPSDTNTISISTLYDRLEQDVKLATDGKQVPVMNGRSVGAKLPRFQQP